MECWISKCHVPVLNGICLQRKRPDRIWGPPSALFNEYRGSFLGLMSITHVHLLPWLRVSGAILLLPLHAFAAWTEATLSSLLLDDTSVVPASWWPHNKTHVAVKLSPSTGSVKATLIWPFQTLSLKRRIRTPYPDGWSLRTTYCILATWKPQI